MSQTREERRTALDDFAATKLQEPSDENLPAVFHQQQTLELVHGAQRVAVLRDERRIFDRLRALAAAAGEEFYYRYPVKNKRTNTVDWIEGSSVKLANDVARIYGNCEVDCRFTEQAGTWIFYGRFVDLETGFSLTRPFRARANTSRLGGGDNERREDISFQIAASKAIRNVVTNALRTYCDFAFNEAKASLVDKIGHDIERWRAKTVAKIAEKEVQLARVEAVVGRAAANWLASDISMVIAMMGSVADGMASLDETFPPLGDKPKAGLDEFAASEPGGPDNGSENSGGPINRPDTPSTTAETTGASSLAPQAHGAPVVTLQRYRLCIDKILGAAVDKKAPDPEDRLANLDGPVRDTWLEEMSGDLAFVNKALRLASQVVRKEITEADARRMLEAMVP